MVVFMEIVAVVDRVDVVLEEEVEVDVEVVERNSLDERGRSLWTGFRDDAK